jgi:aspartate aminotransferase
MSIESNNPLMTVASRVRALRPSPTVAVAERARELVASGIDLINLSGGDPDFASPPQAVEAAVSALEAEETHYGASAGLPELRAAIARKLWDDNGIEVSADEGVLVTPGGKAALFEAFQALVEPGAEVLIPTPAWPSFGPMVELAGGKAVYVPLRPEGGFRLSADLLDAAATEKTRLLVINSPNNPTGRVLDEDELEALCRVACERDLIVLSDEIYEKVVFDGRRHRSIASLPGMRDRTLTFNGFSKAYAMTGWRLGYVAGSPHWIRALAKVHGHLATCVPSFLQRGALAALESGAGFVESMVATWQARRDLMVDALKAAPGVSCFKSEGAFYLLVDVRALGGSSESWAHRLLNEANVAVTPGNAFGTSSEGFLRLALTAPTERLVEAAGRMVAAFAI